MRKPRIKIFIKIFVFYFVFGNFPSSHSLLSAQNGPGGVGNATTNVLWLRADQQVYIDAGITTASNTNDVQQWNDRSGNAKNAVQATSSYRPNYITNVVNSLPVIRFSAGSDHLIAANVSTANVASVWAVASYSTLPSTNPGIVMGAPAGTGTNAAAGSKSIGMWVSNGAGTMVWGRGIQSNATTRDISQVTTLNVSTFYAINNIYRSATSINQFVNNAAAGNNLTHNGTLSSWADVTIGRQGNESWSGDIAEVVFYNIEVNAAQRIIVDNYLSAKYGLSLSSNDIYDKDTPGNGNFDFEVAGIGRVDASNIHNDARGSGIVRVLNPNNLGNDEYLFFGHNNASTNGTNTTDIPAGVQARMARVWRVSEASSAGASVDVGSIDIQFDLAGLGTVTPSHLRLLVDTDNDGVFSDETGISGASLVSGTIYQFTGVTAITNNVRFSLGTTNNFLTPLPIELLQFSAVITDNQSVDLNWATATEKNNDYFEIERSGDALNWEQTLRVEGAGNSTSKRKYSARDEQKCQQLTYYRLNQVDFDKTHTYSPIVAVIPENNIHSPVEMYPNPASEEITIYCPGHDIFTIEVYDVFGRIQDLSGIRRILNNQSAVLDLKNWNCAVYYVRVGNEILKLIRN